MSMSTVPASEGGASGQGPFVRAGVDLCCVDDVLTSIARFGKRFIGRVFTDREIEDSTGDPLVAARHLAARLAAKEAILKALRPGADRPPWRDIEIRRSAGGWCEVELHGSAAALAAKQGLRHWAVSLTHEGTLAAAVAIATGGSEAIARC